jgi:hypothetical protein
MNLGQKFLSIRCARFDAYDIDIYSLFNTHLCNILIDILCPCFGLHEFVDELHGPHDNLDA